MAKISAYVIAYNEAEKITAALKSVAWTDETIVADSFSTDGTSEIAESLGARVIQIPFKGFGDLRNQAIAACQYNWILSLDADERCTPEARDEILKIIRSDESLDVYYVPRMNFFMGKWIKHSGFYPDYRQPQLFRKGALSFKPDAVHERFDLHTAKPPGFLKKSIWQIPYKNFKEILDKANRYSSLGAVKLAGEGKTSGMKKAFFHAMWSFIQLFILKKGVLDGWPGFVIALGNFEGTFYKYAKLHEAQSEWRPPDSMQMRQK